MRRRVVQTSVLAVIFIIAGLFVFRRPEPGGLATVKIEGDAMSPTLSDGQVVKVTSTKAFARHDIVALQFPGDRSKVFIERVVGLPTERIEVRDGRVWVDGVVLTEPYASLTNYSVEPLILSPDEYYVLGDNRTNSYDSHIWGPVRTRDIRGVVLE